MPQAISYELDMRSNNWQEIENAFAKEYNHRAEEFHRNWEYYEGEHHKPLKIQSDGVDDNVIVNQIGQFADDLVGYLLGDGIRFDASGDDRGGETDDAIEAMWQASRGAILQQMMAMGGCMEGHCAVRLVPVEGDLPKIQRLQGKYFTVFWDALDMSRVLWYRLQYVAGDAGRRIDYVRGQIQDNVFNHSLPGWTEIVYTRKNAEQLKLSHGSDWQREINPVIWEWDFAPIVDWQNLPNPNEYYGYDDVESAIELNDALNLDVSNAQRIVKHHADPKTIMTGATAGDIQWVVGGLASVPQPDAKVYNLEMQSDGAFVQWLTGLITSQIWQSGGMLPPESIKDTVGQLTNFGLRVLYNRAIKKIEKKRLLYAEAFEQIAIRGLTIAGLTPPDKVVTIWPDVLPEDDTAEVQNLTAELQAGIISKETYRERRNIDNDKELDRLAADGQTGDVGAAILGMLNTNRPFNRGNGGA